MRVIRSLSVCAAAVAAILPAPAGAAPPERPSATRLLAFDRDLCFERRDDATPAKPAQGQTVTAVSVGARRGWNVGRGRDLPYHEIALALRVTVKGREPALTLISCSNYAAANEGDARGDLACSLPCEGAGEIVFAARADGILVLRAYGVTGRCGLPPLEAAGDRVLPMRPAPLGICAIPPDWPTDEDGLPELRQRLSKGDADPE